MGAKAPSHGGNMIIEKKSIEARGKHHTLVRFSSFEALEEYFIEHLLGREDARSKVIGMTLIYSEKS